MCLVNQPGSALVPNRQQHKNAAVGQQEVCVWGAGPYLNVGWQLLACELELVQVSIQLACGIDEEEVKWIA